MNGSNCRCGGRHVSGRACSEDAREDFLIALLEEWERQPGLRFGQMIANYVPGSYTPALFTIEDEVLLKALARREGRDS